MKNNQTSAKEVYNTIGIKNIVATIFIFIIAVIILSFNFTVLYKIQKRNIINECEHNAVESSQDIINYLVTSLDTIKLAAYNIDRYFDNGDSSDTILSYMERESDTIINVIDENYTGLYGYINGEYLDGSGWVPDADYVATERPWYIQAKAANGEIVFVDPYLDSQTGTIMMTIGKLLSDNESVVALDLSLERIQGITADTVDSSYDFAMVLDSTGGVVSHSDKDELGKNYLEQKNTLENAITREIFKSNNTKFEIKYKRTKYIVFAKEIGNGWYCVSVINKTHAFRPLKTIILISLIAILLFAVMILFVVYNITSKHIVANKLNRQLESMSHVYVSMYDINLVTNTFSEISNTSEKIAKMIGDSGDNAKQKLYSVMEDISSEQSKKDLLEFIDLDTLEERLGDSNTITIEYKNIRDRWCRGRFVVAERDNNDKIIRVLWLVEKIDKEKRKQEKLQYLSETDRMTGVNNRGSGEKKIKELISSGQGGMFVLLDVDKFKSINDTFGHNTGDKVLISLADNLQKAFRANDIILRLGGDEFAVFVPDVHNKNAGERIIERLFNTIDSTDIEELGGKKYYISVGVSFYQHNDTYDFEELYKRADSRTYESKKHTGNYVSYYKVE